MCGIVGYVGGREACPVLLKGLHRLEYRGYDSAGVAMVGKDGALNVYKCKGKVSDLEHFLEGKELGGSIGIAHTRWATHGVPNDVNAHPHYSESENIALIHNGIIENYRVLKDALEENGYTFRSNLREMSFPYVESSDTFTIRATGDWQISDTPDSREMTNAYGWVHVDQLSGKGDPGTYQKVTVTCDQNTSEERNATIYLHGCGEENVAIAIRQDNGIFEWKPFDNGQQFDVSGMLKLNAEAGAKLRIPYIKALGTEKYTVTVTQTGGEGITAASGSYSISAAGNGYIEVPLTGTATRQGIVTFAVKAMDEAGAEKDFGSVSTIVRAGFDAQGEELPLLTQNFGKFPWGGDCIGQKAGVTTADKTVANLSLDNETVSVTAGTNASIGGITSTVRNGNAAFYRAIGMEGWTGYLNYMCPGYIQLGAASDNADGQPGNLISPVLNIPAGYDLLLTCKVAIWAAAPDQGMVGICEKNDGFWIPKGTLDKIVASTKSYVSLDIPAYTWVEVTAVIPNPGAKANLAFFISTADSWFSGSSVKAGRWYIDDIKLVY